jgi:hypothetical protein
MSWKDERSDGLDARSSPPGSNFASWLKPFASRLKNGAIVTSAMAMPFDPVSDTS